RHSDRDAVMVALSLLHGAILPFLRSPALVAVAMWWNANTISHNFIHLPFFRSERLNRAYSLYLSLLLGFPQSVWRERHLAHHAQRRPRLSFSAAICRETAILIAGWGALMLLAPSLFWTVYLPGCLVGLVLCYLHGYFEHYTGTMSYYGQVYNFAFFND